jgi:sigma-B regulation protein RsbU (phosphoserine phosphatase)
MKILIAEDDGPSRRLLARHLTILGRAWVATADGEEAWMAFQASRFQILISDWTMPGIDGLELCRRVRERDEESYTYVIMLTARDGKASYLEAMRAGADDFLTKPFDGDQLEARIQVAERLLKLRSRLRQLEGLLPICSYCKRIRDEQQAWIPLDHYVATQASVRLSHGVCPECIETQLRPEIDQRKRERRK